MPVLLPEHQLCLACYASCFERLPSVERRSLGSISITPEEVMWHGLLSNTRVVAKCILTLLWCFAADCDADQHTTPAHDQTSGTSRTETASQAPGLFGTITLRLATNLFEGGTGCHEWEAGFLLAEFVFSNPGLFQGVLNWHLRWHFVLLLGILAACSHSHSAVTFDPYIFTERDQ